jgi:hypothetical protein
MPLLFKYLLIDLYYKHLVNALALRAKRFLMFQIEQRIIPLKLRKRKPKLSHTHLNNAKRDIRLISLTKN